MPNFSDRFSDAIHRRATPVVVGLDPRLDQLPLQFQPRVPGDRVAIAAAFAEFCKNVIDVVAPLVPAVKPQAAFFEELGPSGMHALSEVVEYARTNGLLVIIDAKRNDIGSTAEAYARGFLGVQSAWGGDALTVSPYLGEDSITPFYEVATRTDSGLFVLVKTSNPGSKTFQDLQADGTKVYLKVAEMVESLAQSSLGLNGYGAVGAVVGATYPEQLSELRGCMPHSWFLVPGFGAQGGTARDVAGAFDPQGLGAVVNNSRGIIFAHRATQYKQRFGEVGWQGAVEAATREMIEQLRVDTPAGQLLKYDSYNAQSAATDLN